MNSDFSSVSLQKSISAAKSNIKPLLKKFILNDNYLGDIQTAFGKDFERSSLDTLSEQWLEENEDIFPEIEIISASEINGADGAFSRDTNKIYLAQEFLESNLDNPQVITKVLLEEYGHYVDNLINKRDSSGDEGAIFAALVLGEELSSDRLQELQEEDDSAIVVIDGESIAIEQVLQLDPNPKGNTDGEYVYVDGLLSEESFFSPLFGGEAGESVLNASGNTRFTYSFLNSDSASFDDEVGDYAKKYFDWRDEFDDFDEKASVRLALKVIENVANVEFEEINDDEEDADFKFVKTNTKGSRFRSTKIAGRAAKPRKDDRGFVYFNIDGNGFTEANIQQGGLRFYAILHETLHGLGLSHPHDGELYPGVGGSKSTGKNGLNTSLFTTMSYNYSPTKYGKVGTPMGFDIAALQFLYGANKNYRKDPSNPDDEYLLKETQFYKTIWDTGGDDTISGADEGKGVWIDLRNLALRGSSDRYYFISENLDQNKGFIIAPYPVIQNSSGNFVQDRDDDYAIENAIGSDHDDDIYGNEFDNKLEGNNGKDNLKGRRGDDILDGGDGDDTLRGGSISDTTEIDTLIGGKDKDKFYLGNNSGLYYNDKDPDTNGRQDFALIKDLDFSAGDTLKIGGSFSKDDFITSRLTYNGVPGTAYILTKGQSVGDLIAFAEDKASTSALTNISNINSIAISNNSSSSTIQFNSTPNTIEMVAADIFGFEELPDTDSPIINFEDIFEVFTWDEDDTNAILVGLQDVLSAIQSDVVEELAGEEGNVFLNAISQQISNLLKNSSNLSIFDNIAAILSQPLSLAEDFIPEDFVGSLNQQFDNNGFDDVEISLVEDNGDEVIFGLSFSDSLTDTIDLNTNLNKLGLPNLGISLEGGTSFNFDTSTAINFGVNVDTNEFFVDTGLEREVDINLNLENSQSFTGKVEIFELTASDRDNLTEEDFEENPGKAFQASLNFGLDLQDDPNDEDVLLTLDELSESSIEPSLIGELNVNPELEISSNIQGSPSLKANLDYNAQYNFLTEKYVAPEQVVTPDNDIPPSFRFNDVEIDPGEVKNIIAGELLDSVDEQIGNLTEIVGEFDGFLAQLEDTLNSDIFELDIPFLGDALSKNLDATSFITNIRNSLSSKFQNIVTDSAETLVAELDSIDFISAELKENSAEKIVVNLGLDGNTKFNTNLAPDLGFLDSLGLDISAKADIDLDFKLDDALEISIDKDGNVSLVPGENPLEIDLGLALPNNTVFDGDLGFLDVNLESTLGDNEFDFGVDIDLDTFDYKFEYPKLDDVRLFNLELAIPDIEVGNLPKIKLPKLSTDLSFDFTQLDDDLDNVDSDLPFSFKDVTIDTNSLYNELLKPFVNALDPFIEAIAPFTDALTTEVAPLSKVSAIREFFDNPQQGGNGDGKVTLVEIASNRLVGKFVGDKEPKYQEFLQAIVDIVDFSADIDRLAASGREIDLGDIALNNLGSGDMTPTYSDRSTQFENSKPETPSGFAIPLFDDPLPTAFSLLTGGNTPLIEYTMPELAFGVELSKFFPVVGPLGVRLGGSLAADAQFKFGFDTYGLQTGNQVQGFYVADDPGSEVNLNARVTAEGGAELGVARGFVGGNLTGNIGFDLVDPNNDGQVRPAEFSSDITKLFETNAKLTAGLQAWYEIDLGFGLFGDALTHREDFNFGDITLASIEPSKPPFSPALGYVVDSTLILNQKGDRAVGRNITNELIQISQSSNTTEVVAFGHRQNFNGVSKVSGNGRDGNDTLEAFANVSIATEFDGGSGNDNLIGGSGNDTLLGGSGNDRVSGKAGNDSIAGEAGNDTLFGGASNDLLEGGRGNDNLVGEAGNDTLDGDRGRDTLAGGEGNDNLSGGSDRDTLNGEAGDDTLDGGSDRDLLDGFRGDDLLKGGFGEDTLKGGDNNDTLQGGDSNDLLDGGNNDDVLEGDSGEDVLYGRSGNDSLDGGFGDDSLYGESGNDTLYGNLGNDTLDGNLGNDSLIGGVGNDSITGKAGDDTLLGSDGEDTLDGGEDDDALFGGREADSLVGEVGSDRLSGGEGKDTLDGGEGADTLEGGGENDELYGGTEGDRLLGGLNNDLLEGASGQDTLRGEAGEDILIGGSEADLLNGGDNDDSLAGESGEDILQGEAGEDTLIGGADRDLLEGGSGSDSLFGGFQEDTLRGGTENDVLYGEDGQDSLLGEAGDDSLFGGNANDILEGGDGDDTLEGNQSNDSLYGGNGKDLLQGNDGIDLLRGEEGDDELSGGVDDDALYGDEGGDELKGDGGNDSLYGGDGADNLKGGADNDFLQGDDLDESVRSDNNTFDDVLDGESGDDDLFGASGDDELIGGDGDDTLTGGFDNDTLTGNSGKNVFVLAPNKGTDIIEDFTLLPDDFNPEAEGADQIDADIILLSDGLSFNFVRVEADGNDALIIDRDTNDTLARLKNIDAAKLTRAYFDEENVAPDRLEFESKKDIYAQDEPLSLVNTLVRDANGIQDVELIDFWLKGYRGDDTWTDLNNFLADLDGNLGFSDLNNLNSQTLIGEKVTINNAHWLDYNGDRNLDIFNVRQGYQELNSYQTIYHNEGNDKFKQTQILPGYSVTGNAWGDYDNDGDLDLIGESLEGAIQKTGIWQNDSKDNFAFVNLPAANSIENGIANWGDYDNDSDLDLVVTGIDSSDESQVHTQIFNNDGNGNLVEIDSNISGSLGTSDWGDADGDGDLDLIVSGNSNLETNNFTTAVYLNNNGTFIESFSINDVKQGTVKWGDYNEDGILDFVVVGAVEEEIPEVADATINKGYARIYQGDGIGGFNLLQEVEGIQNGSVDWGDYDGDDDLDLLVTGLSNQFRLNDDGEFERLPATYIYRYESETNTFSQIIPDLPEVYGGNSNWGDYDDDGDLDILTSGFDFFNNPITKVYRNDGYGTFGNDWRQSDPGNHNLFGGDNRRDVFVIDTESEIETVYNFQPGQDLLYLSNSLTFGDLEFQDTEGGNTAIVLKATNKTLATLQNISAEKISESDLVIVLDKDSRDLTLENFDSDRSLIYLSEGLNKDIIDFRTSGDNTQIIYRDTEEIIATVNNILPEDLEPNLVEERVNFIDPVFTAFNNDSRLASFDYELGGLTPGEYTLKGTAYDHETANDIISRGVTLIPPSGEAEGVVTNGVVTLEGTQVIDWVYQAGSNERESSDGIVVDSSGNIFITGTTDGLLGQANNSNNNDKRDYWYGSLNSQGQLRGQIEQIATRSGDGAIVDINISPVITIDNQDRIHTIRNYKGNNEFGELLSYARIDRIDPATGRIIDFFQQDTNQNLNYFDVSADSTGELYLVGNLASQGILISQFQDISAIISSSAREEGTGIAIDRNDNIYITGNTRGELVSGELQGEIGESDAWIAKYNKNPVLGLEQVWIHQLGSTDYDFARDIATDDLGNVYVTGDTFGNLGGENAGQTDIWLTKYDPNGESLWTKQLGTNFADNVNGMTVDNSGNIYLTGYTQGDLEVLQAANESNGEAWLTKYDTNGNLVWTQGFGAGNLDIAQDIFLDDENEGNVYLTGLTRSSLDGENKGNFDAWVAKFNDLQAENRIEKERFILGDSTGNFYNDEKRAQITGFDVAIGDTIQLHGSSEDYTLRPYFTNFGIKIGTEIVYLPNNETVARIPGVDIAETEQELGLRKSTEFQAGNVVFVSEREDNVESIDFTVNNNGTSGDDELVGTANVDDVLTGGDGEDTLIGNLGGEQGDYLDGGAGDDTLYSGEGTFAETEDDTNDSSTTSYLYGWEGNDELWGSTSQEELYGGTGNDEVRGGTGNDTLDGGAGDDTLVGGGGKDLVSYRNELSGVTVNLETGIGKDSQNGEDILSLVEDVTGSEYADTITGNADNNTIVGLAGDDVINGGAGNDELHPETGNDLVDAAAGNDTLVSIGGNDTFLGGQGNDTYAIEPAIFNLESAFTALGGGDNQRGFIYNADNFPINWDTFRRFYFDGVYDRFAQFGLEVITVEASDPAEPVLANGQPQLRWLDYPLQIQDGGGTDILTSDKLDIEAAATRGDRIGLAQSGASLIVDYDRDSYPNLETDIVIRDFFDPDNPGLPGTGFIASLDGNDSAEVLQLAKPFTPIDFALPEIAEIGFWLNSGTWGDYDSDGDLDLLIASGDENGNGFTRIYRNDDGKFDFSISLEGYSNVNSLDWGDYDLDGDLDVLVVGYDNQPGEDMDGNLFPNSAYKAAVYRNEGSDRFNNVESIDIESQANGDLLFATWGNYVNVNGVLDYDNKLDILLRRSATPAPDWGYHGFAGSLPTGFDEVQQWQLALVNNNLDRNLGYSNQATNAWGDFDRDGDLDIVVVDSLEISMYLNEDGEFNSATSIFKIDKENRNNGGKILKSSVVAGDYNNDGFLDLLTTTYTEDDYASVAVYAGNSQGTFDEIPTLIPNLYNGEASWGDYDSDGDLDIFLIGTAGRDSEAGIPFARVYRNNIDTPNTAPKTPRNLRISAEGGASGFSGETIKFQWNRATDEETADISLTYNLRIGTTPGGSEILAAGSLSDDGKLLSPEIGNVGTNLEYIIDNTSGFERGGTYYWSVQAVDGGYLGSEFAAESSFTYLPYDETATNISPVDGNSAWGDYDNDGDLDLVKGTNLFNNNLDESETRLFNSASSLDNNVSEGRVDNAWGDYNGDGNLDLVVTGDNTTIYRNNADSATSWLNQLGTGDADSANVIATDAEGNVYVAGSTSGNLAGDSAENTESTSIWLAKYNSSGDRLWLNQFGTAGVDTPRGISVADNNVYLTGFTNGEFGETVGNIWIAKYDSNGNRDESFGNTNNGFIQYGSSGTDFSNDLATDSQGNIYVLGSTNSDLGGAAIGQRDIWLQKYDRNGNFVANLPKIGTVQSEDPVVIAIDSEDNIYTTGWTFGELAAPNPQNSLDIWLAKYNSDGSLDPDFGNNGILQYDTEDSYIVGGSTVDRLGNVYLVGLNNDSTEYWIVKYDATGNQLWEEELDIKGFSFPKIATDSSGNVYLTGATNENPETSQDGWIAKYDSDGNFIERKDIISSKSDGVNDIAIDDLDNVYVAGQTNGRLQGSREFSSTANFDAFVSKINDQKFISNGLALPQVTDGAVTWGDRDNDGDLDLFLMGSSENELIAQIYDNQGESGFVLASNQTELVGLSNSDAAWGDYDNDGDLDLAVIGKNNENTTIAGIYQNNLGILNNFIALNPAESSYGNDNNPKFIAWGDYNSDGYLDLLVTANTNSGYHHQIYKNNQDNSFSDIQAEELGRTAANRKAIWADFNNDGQLDVIASGEGLATFENQNNNFQSVYSRDVLDRDLDVALAAGDYDSDGDLDFLSNASGYMGDSPIGGMSSIPAPAIYANLLQNKVNNLPTAPTELTSVPNKNSVTLEWNTGTDLETPVEGLTYNLRMGTTPGGNDVMSSMSDSEGVRLLPALGNVNHNSQWELSNLANGKYYWSVQTVDSTFAGSSFADEGEFTISNPQIEIKNISLQEGDSGEVEAEFTVTLNVETINEPVTVDYTTIDGTATAGEDYEATNGTLTFNPESEDNPVELSKTIKVKVFGDRIPEETEAFSIELSNVSDNAEILISQATATIESEATDGEPLFPDYNFSEFKVNDTDAAISIARGQEIAIAGSIIDRENFNPDGENPPIYRLYLSQNDTIERELESSEDISLVDNNTNNELQIELNDGEYRFTQDNILIPATIEAGEYYLIAEVNPDLNQPEEKLDNNFATIPITVTTLSEEEEAENRQRQEAIFEDNRDEADYQLPDLEVSNIKIANGTDEINSLAGENANDSQNNLEVQNLEVSWTVTNNINSAGEENSTVEAGDWGYQIYLSDDDKFDSSDRLLEETEIIEETETGEINKTNTQETLEPGSSQTITTNILLTEDISEESYLFVASYPIQQLDFEPEDNLQQTPLIISDRTPTLDIDGNGKLESQDYTLIDLYASFGDNSALFDIFLQNYSDVLLGEGATRKTGIELTDYLSLSQDQLFDLDGNNQIETSDYSFLDLYSAFGANSQVLDIFLQNYSDVLLGEGATRSSATEIIDYLDRLLV